MLKTDKSALELNTNRKYLIMRFVTGCRLAFSDWKRFTVLLLYITSAGYVWTNRGGIFPPPETIFFAALIEDLTEFAIILCMVVGLIFTLVILGTPWGAKSAKDNLWKAGLVNHAGESPLLISRYRSNIHKKVVILEFIANGIPLNEWQDRKSKIESALNIYLIAAVEGRNKTRILLHTVPVKGALPEIID